MSLEILGMLLDAREDGCSVEIVHEKIDLPGVRQIIAPGVKVVDVYAGQNHVLQVLIQSLLRGQLATVREMVVEVGASNGSLHLVTDVEVVPEDFVLLCGRLLLKPAFGQGNPFDILVTRVETEHDQFLSSL